MDSSLFIQNVLGMEVSGRDVREGMKTTLQVLGLHQHSLVTFGTIKLPQRMVLLLQLPLETREKLGFQAWREQVYWAEQPPSLRSLNTLAGPSEAPTSETAPSMLSLCPGIFPSLNLEGRKLPATCLTATPYPLVHSSTEIF